MKNILNYFVQGLIIFIPLIITLFLLFKLFDFFVGFFCFVGFGNGSILNPILGFLGTILFICLIGFLASSYLFKKVFSFIETKLERAPFIRHIYSPIKDFTNAFIGNKKRFNKPVIVLTNPIANIEEIGFVTQEDLKDFDINNKIAVYMPLSYSLSGKLIIVPKENVKPIKMNASDTMKFIISGGVTDVE